MAIQIGAKPDSGFDDPIGMLKDCHRRIESFLGILGIVVGRAKRRSLTDEERSAVQAALQYFRTGGQRHTADEEQSLFPRLRKTAADSFKEIDSTDRICPSWSTGKFEGHAYRSGYQVPLSVPGAHKDHGDRDPIPGLPCLFWHEA